MGEELRTSQCFKRVYFQDSFLAVIVAERSLLQKVGKKPWTQIQIKHKLSTLANVLFEGVRDVVNQSR